MEIFHAVTIAEKKPFTKVRGLRETKTICCSMGRFNNIERRYAVRGNVQKEQKRVVQTDFF
jgi:hypothetical protein